MNCLYIARYPAHSRLSAENVKQAGRHLGKLCHSFSIAVFDVVLDLLQSYVNLIDPVVQALKYLTPMELDILTCMACKSQAERSLRGAHVSIDPMRRKFFAGYG